MDIFSKKTLLSAINGGGIYGAASLGQTVKFKFASTIAKALASKTDDGALIFAVDATSGAGAIWAGTDLVSSRVLDYAIAASASKDHDQKTVTLTYIDDTEGLTTKTFDLIDEAGLKAYFTSSDTITITDGTANVNVDASTILIDSTNKYLKSGLNIFYKAPVTTAGSEENAKIQLRDAHNAMLSEIDVANIIGNGVVDHTSYNKDDNTLSIFFKTATGGTQEVKINLSELFDINDWAVKSDSTDFLSLGIDTSTAEIGVKLADVTFTPAANDNPANLTVDTTNGKILDAADAIPALKSYIDAVQADNSIAVESKNDYIDASIDANNNKKINIEAQTADLTISKVGDADSTIAGVANKLAKSDDTASKVQSFVNARISEEVAKLDADITSDDATYVNVEVKEVDGKINDVIVTQTKSTITASASDLSATTGIADGQEFAAGAKTYIDGQIEALDTSVSASTADGSISFKVVEEDGLLSGAEISYVKAQTTFTDAAGETPASLTSTDGLLSGAAIQDIVSYVNAKTGALDSSVTGSDASTFVTVNTVQSDGALSAENVTVQYATVTAAPGDITVTSNGIVKGDVLEAAIEGALTWTVLS